MRFAEKMKKKPGSLRDLSLSAPERESDILRLPPTSFYADEQVRREFTQAELQELADNLREHGQIQPIKVFPEHPPGQYKIFVGERRWRAAKLIDGFELEAIVHDMPDSQSETEIAFIQIAENDQRQDLSILEMASALQKIASTGEYTLDQIAKKLGWITSSGKPAKVRVSRLLNVLELPERGMLLIENGSLTDLYTIDLLRRLNKVSSTRFEIICSLIEESGEITRSRIQSEYDAAKAEADQKKSSNKNPAATQSLSVSEREDEAPNRPQSVPGLQDKESDKVVEETSRNASQGGSERLEKEQDGYRSTPSLSVMIHDRSSGGEGYLNLVKSAERGLAVLTCEDGSEVITEFSDCVFLQVTK